MDLKAIVFRLHVISNVFLILSVVIASSSWSPTSTESGGNNVAFQGLKTTPSHQYHRPRSRTSGFEGVVFRKDAVRQKRPRRLRSVDFRQQEKQILDKVLGTDVYDRRIRPGGIANTTESKTSTVVNVNIYIRSINDIDDYKMEFSVQITFREQWNDERLKFDDFGGRFKYLTLTDPRKVWMPDTFFRNEKYGHFHAILVNNVYVRVFPNGDVLYSIRISLTLSCPMDLKLYPMDRQTCSLKIASYGYTTDDILYLWKRKEPVQLAKSLNLPRFRVERATSSYCTVKTNTGEYSCLSVDLVFKRQFSYYLITIYVPGCMLVVVSWVSFWLDPHAVPARVALGVTTLLTMSTQTASINSALPPVAYTKAIDVWQGVCVTFVFSALLEYALVNYALRADRSYLLRKAARGRRSSDFDFGGDDDDDCGPLLFDYPSPPRPPPRTTSKHTESNHVTGSARKRSVNNHTSSNRTNLLLNPLGSVNDFLASSSVTLLTATSTTVPANTTTVVDNHATDVLVSGVAESLTDSSEPAQPKKYPMEKAKRIDVTSRILFPMVFAVFNLAYWSFYLSQAYRDATKKPK